MAVLADLFDKLFQAAKRQRLESEDLYAKGHQWDEIELKFDDGQSIYVSKGFLSYMSPVFQGMFRSECKEVTNNCVELKGKDREVFKKILLRMDPRSGKSFKSKYLPTRMSKQDTRKHLQGALFVKRYSSFTKISSLNEKLYFDMLHISIYLKPAYNILRIKFPFKRKAFPGYSVS